MITSKGVRILCNIAVGIAYFVALILLVAGIVILAGEQYVLGIIYVFLSIVLPLIANLAVYPLFALSQMESNIANLNNELSEIYELLRSAHSETPTSPAPNTLPVFEPVATPSVVDEGAIDFINKKYNLNISINDDIFSIKEQIADIETHNQSIEILKNRVICAKTYDDILVAINNHRVVSPLVIETKN